MRVTFCATISHDIRQQSSLYPIFQWLHEKKTQLHCITMELRHSGTKTLICICQIRENTNVNNNNNKTKHYGDECSRPCFHKCPGASRHQTICNHMAVSYPLIFLLIILSFSFMISLICLSNVISGFCYHEDYHVISPGILVISTERILAETMFSLSTTFSLSLIYQLFPSILSLKENLKSNEFK